MHVYYLGPEGSFSHKIAATVFKSGLYKLQACKDFAEIVKNTLEKTEVIGVLPFENSLTSSVHENIDAVFENNLHIVGEANLRIVLDLMALKEATITSVKTVFSHPKALAQCKRYLNEQGWQAEVADSTAAAAALIKEKNDKTFAAIGDKSLAEQYGLNVLVENIGDYKKNMTRFVFISQDKDILGGKKNKMSVIFKVKHEQGSLAKVLQSIADAGGNLTKIESRPIPETEWEYNFYADLEITEGQAAAVTDAIKMSSLEYKVMGVYEKGLVY